MQKNSINITKSDVIWNYLGYGLSFGINIFLLPLVLHFLPEKEMGLWYVFMAISSLIILLDLGFTPQISRTITYVYSGATNIEREGIQDTDIKKGVDFKFLCKIIYTSKYMYIIIATIALFLLLTVGTPYIQYVSVDIYSMQILVAWIIFSLACFINLFFSYYTSIFKGIGKFVILSKAAVFSKLSQICVAFVFLYFGFGILAMSISYFFSGIVYRCILYYFFRYKIDIGKKLKESSLTIKKSEIFETFKTMSHNAWRDGLVTISRYIFNQSNTLICSAYLGLVETASYALSVQIITVISYVSLIYYTTVQPAITEAIFKKDKEKSIKIFSMAWVIFVLFFIISVFLVAICGKSIFVLIKSQTTFYVKMFVIVAIYTFLEANHSLFASYISTSNRLPYTGAYVASAIFSIVLSIILVTQTHLGIWALIISPLIVQLFYNNWKWPYFVLKENNINLLRLINLGYSEITRYLNLNKKIIQ